MEHKSNQKLISAAVYLAALSEKYGNIHTFVFKTKKKANALANAFKEEGYGKCVFEWSDGTTVSIDVSKIAKLEPQPESANDMLFATTSLYASFVTLRQALKDPCMKDEFSESVRKVYRKNLEEIVGSYWEE